MNGYVDKTKDFLKKSKKFVVEKNILTYVIFLLISTVLWFLNILNNDFTTEINYPIKYVDYPKEKLVVSDLPSKISLEVTAKGFSLLRYKASTSFLPILFSINTQTRGELENPGRLTYDYNTNNLRESILPKLSSDITLIGIKPDIIPFRFSAAKTKTVPVIPQIDYTLNRLYMLKDRISIVPSAVVVNGPESIIDTLQAIYTEPIKLRDLSGNVTKNVSLQTLKGTQLLETTAKVVIEVERYTEAKRSIPITIENVPKAMNVRLFPSTVDITYEVGLSRYDSITDSNFKITVDYNQVASSPNFLKVNIKEQPSFINNLILNPETVEYLIERNN